VKNKEVPKEEVGLSPDSYTQLTLSTALSSAGTDADEDCSSVTGFSCHSDELNAMTDSQWVNKMKESLLERYLADVVSRANRLLCDILKGATVACQDTDKDNGASPAPSSSTATKTSNAAGSKRPRSTSNNTPKRSKNRGDDEYNSDEEEDDPRKRVRREPDPKGKVDSDFYTWIPLVQGRQYRLQLSTEG
jgi:hypothetical protein